MVLFRWQEVISAEKKSMWSTERIRINHHVTEMGCVWNSKKQLQDFKHFFIVQKITPWKFNIRYQKCCFGKCISGWYTSRTRIDSSLNYTKRWIGDENSSGDFWMVLWCETLQRKRSLCSRKIITVKGFVGYWSLNMILRCLVVEVEAKGCYMTSGCFFHQPQKKILPKVPRKYEFNLKKSPPDGLHTTIPPRSSTCQQNVRSSQKFSTLTVWSFPERLKKIQVVTKEFSKCLQDADSSHGWAAELLKCS